MTIVLAVLCTACALGAPQNGISASTATATKTAVSTDAQRFYSFADEIVALSKFDPRDALTPVKDQGGTNLCWAYSATQASEASILKSGLGNKDSLRLNPQALAYRKYVRNADPLGNTQSVSKLPSGGWTQGAGQIAHTPAVLSMWQGPIGGDKPAADVWENSLYRLESANAIYSGKSGEDRIDEIKRAIAQYGAVTSSCYYDGGTKQYYNDNAINNGIPHAITLVGWDDNIDKSNFAPKPASANGGWLVKNSYNDNGYFWLTYESKIVDSAAWSFSYAPREEYDYNYYYDNNEDDQPLIKRNQVANVYQAKKGTADQAEYLKAVNVGFVGNDVEVTVQVYTDLTSSGPAQVEKGTLAAQKTQTFKYGGYNTIKLDTPIKLAQGSYFSIVVNTRNSAGDAFVRMVQSESKKPSYGGGYYGYDYISYGGAVARIKAYTKLGDDIPEQESPDDEIKDWNFTNLVLFAKFQDEDEFTGTKYGDTAVKEIINNTYNMSEYSVRDYMQNVSNDKIKMRTLYLYDKGGSLTLSKPRGYYAIKDDANPIGFENSERGARMYELKEDWKNAIQNAISRGAKPSNLSGTKLFDLSDLDKNGDGKIDNITVIYKNTVQNINVRHGDPLWDYRDHWTAVELQDKGKTYTSGNYIQLTLSYQRKEDGKPILYKAQDNLPFVNTGKIYHEMLHVFGVKDLYRSESQSPVSLMSIMGKPIGPVGQFVSAKEREAMGFLDEHQVQTINASGTYTLDVLTKGGGVMGYKMDIPSINKTLYLEYRNFQGTANKYDSQNKDIYSFVTGKKDGGLTLKSGLVCYLATTDIKFPSNVGTSGNKWNYEIISAGKEATKSDSAVGLGERLVLPAGLVVNVNQMGENRLTFSISGVENVVGCQHEWGKPTYTWSADNTMCTAKRVCTKDSSHVEEEVGKVTARTIQNQTCDKPEIVEYTATFEKAGFVTQTKRVQTKSASGHSWGEPTYTWSADNTMCTAKRVCAKDSSHVDEEVGKVTARTIQNQTCDRAEIVEYTATFEKAGFVTQTKRVQTKSASGHSWGEPTYTWSADNTQVTATRVCGIDSSHVQSETVMTVKSTIKQPTCCEKGKIKYRTARFGNSAFVEQEKIVDTDYAEHEWGNLIAEVPPTCTEVGRRAHYKCAQCGKYFDENKQPTTWESLAIPIDEHAHMLGKWIDEVPPTKDKEGTKGHYKCACCNKLFDKDGKKVTSQDLVIPPIVEHKIIVNGEEQIYKEGESVTIVAKEPEKDQIFKGWRNEKGEIVSMDREYTFVANGDTNLVAVYEPAPVPTPPSGEDKPAPPSDDKPTPPSGEEKPNPPSEENPTPPIENNPSTDKENVSGQALGIAVGSGIMAIIVVAIVAVVIVLKKRAPKPDNQNKK